MSWEESKISLERTVRMLGELVVLKFFPQQPEGLVGLARIVTAMCNQESELRWLVDEALKLNEWPGPAWMRVKFCERFRPADGMAASPCTCGCGQAHTFQLKPTQVWPPRIGAPEVPLLPSGHIATADTRIDVALRFAVTGMEAKSAALTDKPTEAELEAAPEWLKRI